MSFTNGQGLDLGLGLLIFLDGRKGSTVSLRHSLNFGLSACRLSNISGNRHKEGRDPNRLFCRDSYYQGLGTVTYYKLCLYYELSYVVSSLH